MKIVVAIVVIEKYGASIHAALHDVQRYFWKFYARLARHGTHLNKKAMPKVEQH